MTDFLDRWAESSESNAKLVAQEALITETAESLWCALERAGVNRTELAQRLGLTKGHVSQVLSGARNMTLRTLSDICFVLGAKPHFSVCMGMDDGWSTVEDTPIRKREHLRLVTNNGAFVSGDWGLANSTSTEVARVA